jgi:hypothetical protein
MIGGFLLATISHVFLVVVNLRFQVLFVNNEKTIQTRLNQLVFLVRNHSHLLLLALNKTKWN